MKLLVAADEAAWKKKAAQLFLESVTAAVKEKNRAAVAISGGNGPQPFFQLLAEAYYRERIPWAAVSFFWVDERCVPPNHPDSNFGMADRILLSKVPIPKSNIHRMAGEMDSPAQAAKSYESDMRAYFNLSKSVPSFDFIQLGMGDDGHTASLFPRTEALNEKDHWVTSNYVERMSTHRITLTFPVLNNAKRVLMLCPGASKAETVKEVLRDDLPQNRFPAQMVRPAGELIWLIDRDAAAKLPTNIRDTAAYIQEGVS